MRIISGHARGKQLAAFSGRSIRPTPDRVREAVFNILQSRFGTFGGKSVLDLFCGTGAMSLEALSRGARHAWLIDAGGEAARIATANLNACEMTGRASLIRSPVAAALPRLAAEGPFDLIFLDPPYGKGLVPRTLDLISELSLLAPAGVVSAETALKDEVAEVIGCLTRFDHRRYGSTSIHFFAFPESGTA